MTTDAIVHSRAGRLGTGAIEWSPNDHGPFAVREAKEIAPAARARTSLSAYVSAAPLTLIAPAALTPQWTELGVRGGEAGEDLARD